MRLSLWCGLWLVLAAGLPTCVKGVVGEATAGSRAAADSAENTPPSAAPCVRLDVFQEVPSLNYDTTKGVISVVEPPSWQQTNKQTRDLMNAIQVDTLKFPEKEDRKVVYTHIRKLNKAFSPHEGITYPKGTTVQVRHFEHEYELGPVAWTREIETFVAVHRAGCHPNIIRCLGFGTYLNSAFVVLEDAGHHLEFLVSHRTQMYTFLDTFMAQMASALVFLHENAGRVQGMLHMQDIRITIGSDQEAIKDPHFLLAGFDRSMSTRHTFQNGLDLTGARYSTTEELEVLSPLRSLAIVASTHKPLRFQSVNADLRSTKPWEGLLQRVVDHADGGIGGDQHHFAGYDNDYKFAYPDAGVISVMNPLLNRVLQYLTGPQRLAKLDVYGLAMVALRMLASPTHSEYSRLVDYGVFPSLACGANRWLRDQYPKDGILMKEFHARDRLNVLVHITNSLTKHVEPPPGHRDWLKRDMTVDRDEARAHVLAQKLMLGEYDMRPGHVHPFFRWIVDKEGDISTVFWKQGLGMRFMCKGKDEVEDLSKRGTDDTTRLVRAMLRVVPDDTPASRDVCNHVKCVDYSIYLPRDRVKGVQRAPIRTKHQQLPAGDDRFLTTGDQHPAELRKRIHTVLLSAPETTKLKEDLHKVFPVSRLHISAWVAPPVDVEDGDLITVLQFRVRVDAHAQFYVDYLPIFGMELQLTAPHDGRGPVSGAMLAVDPQYRKVQAGVGDRAKFLLRGLKKEWGANGRAGLMSSAAEPALQKYQAWLAQIVAAQVKALYPGQHIEVHSVVKDVHLKEEEAEAPQE